MAGGKKTAFTTVAPGDGSGQMRSRNPSWFCVHPLGWEGHPHSGFESSDTQEFLFLSCFRLSAETVTWMSLSSPVVSRPESEPGNSSLCLTAVFPHELPPGSSSLWLSGVFSLNLVRLQSPSSPSTHFSSPCPSWVPRCRSPAAKHSPAGPCPPRRTGKRAGLLTRGLSVLHRPSPASTFHLNSVCHQHFSWAPLA